MKNFAAVIHPLTKLFLTLLLTVCAVGLHAQAKLSVQGLLKKSDGTSLPDGNYDLTFKFYDAENGGTALEAVTVNTEVNGGVYSAVLSGFTVLDFAVPYFASVSVNGGTELLPRIALTAAPYAISLQGQNNKFPSIGLVKADAIDVAGNLNANTVNTTTATVSGATNTGYVRANGGAPAGGVAGKGFSFKNGGDEDGGMFSYQDNQVSLYANATEKVKLTAGLTELYGDVNTNKLSVYGDHIVNGNQTVNGNSTVVGNAKANAFRARGGAPGGSGSANNGYAFEGNGGDSDSGLFSNQDGVVSLYANDIKSIDVRGNGVSVIPQLEVGGRLYLYNVPNTIDGHNLEWNPPGTEGNDWGVTINTSSRRFKHNIVPLDENFSQILHLQPKIYTRKPDQNSAKEIGYIAEEVDSLGMKCLVLYEDADKKIPLSINYKKMVIFTNEIVKMHHADIEKLKAEVAALTAEKNALGAENASLRADIQKQQADFGKQLDGISRRLRSLETAASNR